jgi:biopolymer transport protein ExbD
MPLKPTPDDAPQLNLTPMIDVVFLLVIFFMAATQFSEVERAVELQLPDVPGEGSSVATVVQPRVVTVSENGNTLLDGNKVTLDELTKELTEAASQTPDIDVLIHGDARSDFQHVAAALAACRAAGVTDVGVTVEVAAKIDAIQRR